MTAAIEQRYRYTKPWRGAAAALSHDRLDVRDRALRILTKRWKAAGHAATAAVAAALDSTSPTLREAVAALCGDGGADPGGAATAAAEELSALAARAAGVPERAAARLGLPAALAAAREGRLPAALPPEAVGAPGRPLDPPPAGAGELADLFSRLLEGVDDPLGMERAMAGLARLGRAAPHERTRADALLARARSDAPGDRPFMGWDLRTDAAGLALAWLDGRGAEPTYPDLVPSRARSLLMEEPWFGARERDRERALQPWRQRTVRLDLNGFASARAWEVASRVSGGVTGELLAMPTHERGGVDPRVLVERVGRAETASSVPGRLDLAQALLRTAGWDEGERSEARAAARALTSRAGAALRRALGDPDAPAPDDPVLARAAEWAAGGWAETVAALRPVTGVVTPAPWKWRRDEILGAAFLYSLPPTRLPIRLDDPVTLLCDLDDPLAWCEADVIAISWYTPHPEQHTSSQALACPAALELVVAHSLPLLNWALERQTAAAIGVLDPLTHAEAPLGPVGLTAVALGTGAVDARLRALSADVLVQAAVDGRLDGAALGERVGELLVAVDLKPARMAATLRQAAMASPVATARIADCLIAAVPPAVKAGMRDAHRLVELLAELLAEHGRAAEDGALRAAVEPFAARGKRNRVAVESARLLGLAPRAYSDARARAARQAVEALLERAPAAR